jgi:hypothetical protein
MIMRFRQVVPGLYRGSAPNPLDVAELKKHFGIKKIVSLDEESGEKIDRACKLLGIEHVKMYIEDIGKTLLNFLSQDLKKLFLEGGPTFVHCREGRDRTGLACALVKCKYYGANSTDMIREAKSIGFGRWIPEKITKLYEKIIRSCKPAKDQNNADIVSNDRERISDNRSGILDEAIQGTFAPYLDQTKNPMTSYINVDQYPTRENYNSDTEKAIHETDEVPVIPQVGLFNNDAGLMMLGPTINMTGFIYD